MHRLDRLLVVVEAEETASAVLGRAILLARHFDSRIDVLFCAKPDGVESGQRFIKGLLASVAAADVPIESCVRTGFSTSAIILERLTQFPADLLIKAPCGRDSLHRRMWTSNDWQLLQATSCDLLLTRGRPWRPVPRIAAAIDLPMEDPGSARAVLKAMTQLAVTIDARRELLHVSPRVESLRQDLNDLQRVAEEFDMPEETWCLLQGDPAAMITRTIAEKSLDLLVLGAHTRRPGWREFFGTLGSRLAREADCDLLLIHGGA
jgi:nucleotide-binding universal stress UspA family protein